MKALKYAVLSVLFPALAFAQQGYIRNDGAATVVNPANGQGGSASVSDTGRLFIESISTPVPVNPQSAAMTPAAMITILPTAVPTAYSTPQFPNTEALKTLTIDNSTGDAEIQCAYGGGTTSVLRVPAGSVFTENYGDRNTTMSAAVGCIRSGPTPSTGSIAIYGSK